MKHLWQALLLRPGGWPYVVGIVPPENARTALSRFDPDRGSRQVTGDKGLWLIVLLGALFFVGVPLTIVGPILTLHFILLIFLSILGLVSLRLLRARIFGPIPARQACIFPRNEVRDIKRRYADLVLTLSVLWVFSIVIFAYSVFVMKDGLGDRWNTFARPFKLTDHGTDGYFQFIECFMLPSGFFAVSGLVWWPMYVFFEWLDARQRIRGIDGTGRSAHA